METKVVRVTSNDSTRLIYLPKEVCEVLGLRKGVYVKLRVEEGKLVVEPLRL
jgi:bifunctional DNA-binding transcriptional regulator/antitoxin component of YhaV-PrlF toxin-antitoxin module